MGGKKPWYKSKTVWSGVITVGASIAGTFGVQVDPETQQQLVNQIVPAITTLTGLGAVIGRLIARDELSDKKGSDEGQS